MYGRSPSGVPRPTPQSPDAFEEVARARSQLRHRLSGSPVVSMNRLVGGDLYDVAALVGVVVGVILAVVVGPWYLWLLLGFAAGNLVSAALRRRAGVPDRSALGRLRGGGAGGRRVFRGEEPLPPARAEASPTRGGPRAPARPRAGRAGTEWREERRRPR